MYDKELIVYDSKYIKNGKVDNVDKLIIYLKHMLNKNAFKSKCIFILDTLLCNSDLFVYKFVFERIGILNYQIINDLDLLNKYIEDNNIIVISWSSSCNYAYKYNDKILLYSFNINKINSLDKKYILLFGDTLIPNDINKPIYKLENNNIIKQPL